MVQLWKTMKLAGADGLAESDIRRAICIGVNTLCLSIFVINCCSGTIFFVLTGQLTILLGTLVEALLMLGIVGLNSLRHYQSANICFYFLINLATFYFGAILGPEAQVQLMFIYILGLIFFLFDALVARAVCTGISLILLSLLEIQFRHPLIRVAALAPGVGLALRIVVYFIVIALVIIIFYLYKRNVLKYHASSREAEASRDAGESLHLIKNNFFQHISHDIRGAYFGVGSICAVVHEKAMLGEPVSPEIAESLMLASQNYKYMLNHFLEFSRFKMGTVDEINEEPVDVAAEVKHIVQLNQYLALEKNIRVEILADPEFPAQLLTDRQKINRIFYNILVNALKFSPAGSRVRVCLHPGEGSWTLQVTDQGRGFQPEQLLRIFEPYTTHKTPENPEGIGLGLYITNYLTKLLDGEIAIDSAPGAGATVRLQFPLASYRA